MQITPIRTAKDHAAALAEIERLWDKAKPGTRDGDRFEILSTLVDAYEREHFPIAAPDPIDAIRFRLEQLGEPPTHLLAVFKTRARLSEVLTRKRRLNLNMIRQLHKRLSIPIEVLVQDYALKRKRRASKVSRSAAARKRRPRPAA